MSIKRCLFLFLWLGIFYKSFGQNSPYEYHINVNGNLYFPRGEVNHGTYPILWYDKETDPKLLLGGIGVGFSVLHALHEKLDWKVQFNLSKHTYWDEPITLLDNSGNMLGPFVSGSSDFMFSVIATMHYHLHKNVSVGTGLGGQLLLASYSRLPNSPSDERPIAANQYYKPLMPVIPLELSVKLKKYLLNIRYEHALLNRYKSPLSEYKNGKYSILYLEVGFKLQ